MESPRCLVCGRDPFLYSPQIMTCLHVVCKLCIKEDQAVIRCEKCNHETYSSDLIALPVENPEGLTLSVCDSDLYYQQQLVLDRLVDRAKDSLQKLPNKVPEVNRF